MIVMIITFMLITFMLVMAITFMIVMALTLMRRSQRVEGLNGSRINRKAWYLNITTASVKALQMQGEIALARINTK